MDKTCFYQLSFRKIFMKQFVNLFLTVFSATFFASCAGVKPVPVETKPAGKNLAIVFTNSTMGAFEPGGCGCRYQGGFPKRAQFIKDIRKHYASLMTFDTGNMLSGKEGQSRSELQVKADYMLAALNHMGTDALNVGVYDCAPGISFLKEKERKLAFPLLSANIKSVSTGNPVFRPYVIKTLNDIKIGFFGLSGYGNPLSLKAEGIFIASPLQSAQKTVAALQEMGCSFIILLSQLSQPENKRIARQVPGIHFILGSSSKDLPENPGVEGSTTILSPGTGGRHAAVLEIFFKNDSSFFYNVKNRTAVMKRIEELKKEERNPVKPSEIDEVVLKLALLEEKFRAFNRGNSYKYSVVTLDSSIQDDSGVNLLVEQYKDTLLRNKLSTYIDRVNAVDLSTLSEEKRLMAIRLMNDIACNGRGSIAAYSSKDPFCRNLARIIVDSIKKGESEGKINYKIIYEQGKQTKQGFFKKKPLDNHLSLP